MIHYKLRCEGGHDFEGWFRDSAAFEEQAQRGLLSCPSCGTVRVGRGLMAPAVRVRPAAAPPDVAAPSPAPVATPTAATGQVALPDAARALLQRMRLEVERHCDDMGDRFANEAIRMHRGEVAPRGIYGSTTEDDREALADEGVVVATIPWLKLPEG